MPDTNHAPIALAAFKVDEFRRALNVVKGAIERRSTIPVLATVKLSIDLSGSCMLEATDMEMAIRHPVDAAYVQIPSTICVMATELDKLLKALPKDGIFEIRNTTNKVHSPNNQEEAPIMFDGAEYRLGAHPAEDFPTTKWSQQWRQTFTVEAPELVRQLKRIAHCVSTEETRYYLNGVCFDLDKAGQVTLAATDGHRLSALSVPSWKAEAFAPLKGQKPDDQLGFILPRAACDLLVKLLPKSGQITIERGEMRLKVTAGDMTFMTKLIDGTFPDYGRVIPKMDPNRAHTYTTFDVPAFTAAVSRAMAIAQEKSCPVRLEYREREHDWGVYVNGALVGYATRKLPALHPEPEIAKAANIPVTDPAIIAVGFQGRYLLQALAASEAKQVTMWQEFGGAPALMQTPDESWMTVIMPMRV